MRNIETKSGEPLPSFGLVDKLAIVLEYLLRGIARFQGQLRGILD
jgi:hypothetical protein